MSECIWFDAKSYELLTVETIFDENICPPINSCIFANLPSKYVSIAHLHIKPALIQKKIKWKFLDR